jgi:hypothetical protein
MLRSGSTLQTLLSGIRGARVLDRNAEMCGFPCMVVIRSRRFAEPLPVAALPAAKVRATRGMTPLAPWTAPSLGA